MKRKWLIFSIIGILAGVGAGFTGYHAVGNYLADRFGPNTWIGDIYCTGRTVEEVNQELLATLDAPVFTLTASDGQTYTIDLSDTDFQYDYTEVLRSFQKNQSSNSWVDNLKGKHDIEPGNPAFTYNTDKLMDWWSQLTVVKAEDTKPVLELALEESGYVLHSTLENHLDVNRGFETVKDAVNGRQTEFSLAGADVYFDYEMDDAQKKVFRQWENLKEKERCGLVYDMGAEKIVFDEALMSRFIAQNEKGMPLYDEDGKLYYDKEAVDAFMEQLCESYHTYGVKHDFLSSRGEVVQVEGVTYGTEIDTKAEQAFVWEYLSDDELRLSDTVHTPEYIHDTPVHGLNDIGDTYIEVDMGEQKIYFYKEGELLVSSDVVTGNLRNRHDTPEGVNYIYGKAKNRVLRGPGYASFVRYWMPVIRAIGLHDASWRDEFGGDIYKTNGSHGCVNLPDETADIIWDNAEIGTPVIMFY